MLYPLKFKPILKERIWGGKKLAEMLHKKGDFSKPVGESWEISGIEGEESVVSNGFLAENTLGELLEIYMGDLVGDSVYEQYGNDFPLLFKFIDANDDLSIQVHPGDETAIERHECFGKTEMWYIIDAEPDAELVSGFSRETDKEEYLHCLKNKTLSSLLNVEKVSKGDAIFIPAGRVHSIGKGILLAEVQQASDITYRIYDYDRTDAQGNTRELHVEQALDVIDFSPSYDTKIIYARIKNDAAEIVKSDFFTVNKLNFDKTILRNYVDNDSFVVYMCVQGACKIKYNGGEETLQMGESMLIPAQIDEIELVPGTQTEILEVYI
jgi:mannose-6-phosphate isomerase